MKVKKWKLKMKNKIFYIPKKVRRVSQRIKTKILILIMKLLIKIIKMTSKQRVFKKIHKIFYNKITILIFKNNKIQKFNKNKIIQNKLFFLKNKQKVITI